MEKTIYHGSDHIIEKPKFGYGKTYNDYGVGFYCTENPNMAKEWGVGIDHNGYANRYKIECDGLTILDLNAPGYTMLHWLTILLENREFDTSAPLAAEAKEYLMNTFHLDYGKCRNTLFNILDSKTYTSSTFTASCCSCNKYTGGVNTEAKPKIGFESFGNLLVASGCNFNFKVWNQ